MDLLKTYHKRNPYNHWFKGVIYLKKDMQPLILKGEEGQKLSQERYKNYLNITKKAREELYEVLNNCPVLTNSPQHEDCLLLKEQYYDRSTGKKSAIGIRLQRLEKYLDRRGLTPT